MRAELANCSFTNHHLSASNGVDFIRAFHMAKPTKVVCWGPERSRLLCEALDKESNLDFEISCGVMGWDEN